MDSRNTRRTFLKKLGRGFSAFVLLKAALNATGCAGGKNLVNTSPTNLTNELKQRIGTDNPNQFNPAVWDQVRFGSYYDEDPELINIVVFETTDKVINKDEKRYLPQQVWKDLIASVSVDTLPKDAINPMMDAAQRSLSWDNEGPNAGRPKSRPTLKSAR